MHKRGQDGAPNKHPVVVVLSLIELVRTIVVTDTYPNHSHKTARLEYIYTESRENAQFEVKDIEFLTK